MFFAGFSSIRNYKFAVRIEASGVAVPGFQKKKKSKENVVST